MSNSKKLILFSFYSVSILCGLLFTPQTKAIELPKKSVFGLELSISVAGDLELESLQSTEESSSKQKQLGGSLSGSGSGTLSASSPGCLGKDWSHCSGRR
ncbi:MAG: hypothetical protein LBI29_03890 [Rickettsiales bacterium]|nr:hypothetical protein [Rickettsiales bacterium]